jgi:hypothetical protein
MLPLFETAALAVVIAVAFRKRDLRKRPRARGVWPGICRAASRKRTAIALVGILGGFGSAFIAWGTGAPVPRITDEFSYVLAADTFAHGRLTNPPHPLSRHFETVHVIQEPTYMSKYPPAQGLVLAAGQVLTGSPLAGVWLGMGLACAGLCWMLQAWLPSRWALLASGLAALHLLLHGQAYAGGAELPGYWGQSYWGGAIAALGGALLFGSVRRIVERPRTRDGVLLGAGLVILANSRPFEGLIVSLPAAAVLAGRILADLRTGRGAGSVKALFAAALVLAAGFAAMAYYNYRATGDPLRPPYAVHEATYGAAPLFLWQDAPPKPQYHHEALRAIHLGWASAWFERQQSFLGWAVVSAWKIHNSWVFYLSVFWTIPLLGLWWVLKDYWIRFALATCGLLTVALLTETWVLPHYAAPAYGLLLFLVCEGLRCMAAGTWRGRLVGRFVVRQALIISLVTLVPAFAVERFFLPADWSRDRARLLGELTRGPERHIVVVRYGPRHFPHNEWVYNEADIDGAKVVWAREMSPRENRELVQYFAGRRAWLLEPDKDPAVLVPYAP